MKLCGKEVPTLVWKGMGVVTTPTICAITGENMKYISGVADSAKKKMIEGKDYFHLNNDEAFELVGESYNGFNFARGLNVFTESGLKVMLKKIDAHKKKVVKDTPEPKTVTLNSIVEEVKETIESDVNKTEEPATETTKEETVPTIDNNNVAELIKMFGKFIDMANTLVAEQIRQNDEMRQLVRDMALRNAPTTPTVIVTPTDDVKHTKEDELIYSIQYPCDYLEWKRVINKAVDSISELTGESRNEIFSECYKLLNKDYGYVYDQVAKEFNEVYHRSPVNTLENVWFGEQNNPAYKNLMLAKLTNMYNERKKVS